MSANRFDYDAIVVGSGFGGSVAAMRVAEKRWKDEDLTDTNCSIRKYFWQPTGSRARGKKNESPWETVHHTGRIHG
jgi:succinate dehydrogenase/fumarate reductase flavoprotein subunit